MVNPISSSGRLVPNLVSSLVKRMFHSRSVAYNQSGGSTFPSEEKINELRKVLKKATEELEEKWKKNGGPNVSNALIDPESGGYIDYIDRQKAIKVMEAADKDKSNPTKIIKSL